LPAAVWGLAVTTGRAQHRAAVTSGPKPYAKGSDSLQCSQCGLYNSADARYCDQCGAFLSPVPRPKVEDPRELVQCSTCGNSNMPDALYCDECGKRLPMSAYEAALAAKAAVGEANQQAAAAVTITSSSGRQPEGAGMTPQERTAHLDAMALREQRRRALAMAPVTGDTLHDAAAAKDRAEEIEHLWMQLDDLARHAETEAGPFPVPETVAEVRRLRADADAAWQARCAAVEQRDQLNRHLEGRTPEQDARDEERFYNRAAQVRRELWERRPDISDRRPW
jgi:hypothetical protein